jgi:transcriptional regulator with XRE-family HTH domain
MNIGTIVKQRREVKRWNQSELADKSTVTQVTISRLEAGMFDPKISTLRGIASALECLVVDLLPDSDKKKQQSSSDTPL